MNLRTMSAAALFAMTTALATPVFAGVNLIVNGDFASPNESGGWSIGAVPGWYDSAEAGGYAEVGANGVYGLPTVGSGQNLEVNANTWGDVTQTVTGLTIGQSYSLSYLYGGRPGSGGPNYLQVSFGGSLLTTDTGSIGSWTPNYFKVTANATSEVLEFKSIPSTGYPSYGNEITNVSLAVPELSTWAMMLAGFAGLGFVGYRRNKGERVTL